MEAPEQIEQKKALKRVNDLLLRQNYISQSLYRFLRDERVEECVTEILKDILNLYNGKGRVYIFEYNKEHTYRSCTYEVVSEGMSTEKQCWQDIPVDRSEWWNQQILSGKAIVLNSLKQLPEEASEMRREFAERGVYSFMVTPLMAGDHVWGGMGIELIDSYRNWSNEDFQWFSSLGNIISICIELRVAKDKVTYEQSFLRNLFHFMPMGYIRMSVLRDENNKAYDYRITDANQISSHFFGKPLEQYVGVLASDLFSDHSEKMDFILEVLDGKSYKEKDEYFPQTGLYTHWIVYSPEKDEVGRIVYGLN